MYHDTHHAPGQLGVVPLLVWGAAALAAGGYGTYKYGHLLNRHPDPLPVPPPSAPQDRDQMRNWTPEMEREQYARDYEDNYRGRSIPDPVNILGIPQSWLENPYRRAAGDPAAENYKLWAIIAAASLGVVLLAKR